jgi:hypothetical protein
LALALATASLGAAGVAQAEPTFPGVLKDKGGATCIVTCLTCHTDPEGGSTKLKLPFGAAFGAAVKALETSGSTTLLDSFATSDADGDKEFDLPEVRAGHDPTAPGSASICTPAYGCGASHLARTAPLDRGSAAWLAAAAVGCVLAARRRLPFRGR